MGGGNKRISCGTSGVYPGQPVPGKNSCRRGSATAGAGAAPPHLAVGSPPRAAPVRSQAGFFGCTKLCGAGTPCDAHMRWARRGGSAGASLAPLGLVTGPHRRQTETQDCSGHGFIDGLPTGVKPKAPTPQTRMRKSQRRVDEPQVPRRRVRSPGSSSLLAGQGPPRGPGCGGHSTGSGRPWRSLTRAPRPTTGLGPQLHAPACRGFLAAAGTAHSPGEPQPPTGPTRAGTATAQKERPDCGRPEGERLKSGHGEGEATGRTRGRINPPESTRGPDA